MLAQGDLLQAYDLTAAALDHQKEPDNRLAYLHVLALARMGETARAQQAYQRFRLGEADDIDSSALWARLAKDEAIGSRGSRRPRLLAAAAAAYKRVFDSTGAYFPGINAASLTMLAGDKVGAGELARAVLERTGLGSFDSYYAAISAAEALLLLDRGDEAFALAARALELPGADQGARSTTYRQMKLLARQPLLTQGSNRLAELVRPAPVIAYCGHMFRSGGADEAELRRRVEQALLVEDPQIAFGSLACGADILIAEVILERGGELNVILPYLRDDFVRQSVEPGGRDWVPRFERCLAGASEVIIASETPFTADDTQYAYCSKLIMGHARLRAANLAAEAIQVAVWDGSESVGIAGTGADVMCWRDLGGRTISLNVGTVDRRLVSPTPDADGTPPKRVVRAMIFADFAGFSKLREATLPFFWRNVMGRIGTVVERHGNRLCSRNSWGDALFAVTTDAASAAALALDLQAELDAVAHPEFGAGNGMRISANLGPVYEAVDPVTNLTTFYGCEVNRTARIEPITPAGQVYVTAAFAAALSMEALDRFVPSYVGRIPLAKNYGEARMYKLKRAVRIEHKEPGP